MIDTIWECMKFGVAMLCGAGVFFFVIIVGRIAGSWLWVNFEEWRDGKNG